MRLAPKGARKNPPPERWATIVGEHDLRLAQVAGLLGVSPQHVSRLTRAGVLPAEPSPWGRLYRAADVAAHIRLRHERARHDRRVRMPAVG